MGSACGGRRAATPPSARRRGLSGAWPSALEAWPHSASQQAHVPGAHGRLIAKAYPLRFSAAPRPTLPCRWGIRTLRPLRACAPVTLARACWTPSTRCCWSTQPSPRPATLGRRAVCLCPSWATCFAVAWACAGAAGAHPAAAQLFPPSPAQRPPLRITRPPPIASPPAALGPQAEGGGGGADRQSIVLAAAVPHG